MMNERGKSDPAVVATKLANKAERSVAEPVEPRAGTKGNANQQHTVGRRAGNRVTGAGAHTSNRKTAVCRHSPEVGAVCGKAARTDPRVSDLIQSGKLRVGIGLGTPLA